MTRRLQLCFVAPHAWPVLSRDRSIESVGGAEVQQVTLARALAKRGHRVSMVCLDHGQPATTEFDGVTVHRAHPPMAGIPGLRFFHPRLSALWRAMRRADADIYYQRSCGALTGIVAAFAHAHDRGCVYAAAHDLDFDPGTPLIPLLRDRLLYRWGLRQMDALVTQHPAQQVACCAAFGRDSTVIRSAYAHRGLPGRHEGDVLWVGTIKPSKGPEAFVELARRLPRWRFRMIGGGDPTYVAAVRQQAAGLRNLELRGFVPHADVEEQFDGCSVFVSTSSAEGFPNTFLQAWSRGVPTVSFFDPRLRSTEGPAGVVARSVAEIGTVVERWKSDRDEWAEAGRRCRVAFEATFSIESVLEQYESLLERLLAQRAARGVVRPGVAE